MKKTQFVGVRIPEKDMKIIEERAKEGSEDKSTALRQLLEMGIRQYKIERAVQFYKEGKVSLEKASEIAELHVGEMMDLLSKRGVPSNVTINDFREGLKNLERVFKIKLGS